MQIMQKITPCLWFDDQAEIVPSILAEMLNDPDAEKSQRVTMALLQRKKLDIDELKYAFANSLSREKI